MQKEAQELEGENTRLQSEINTIKDDFKTLSTDSEGLKAKIADLEKENSTLKAGMNCCHQ
jgi:predicted nuclease with TOPRIM domain